MSDATTLAPETFAHLTDAERAILDEDDGAVIDNSAATEAPEDDDLRRDPDIPLAVNVNQADIADRLAHADAAEIDLAQKFDDGDITAREYRDQMRQIDDLRNDARWQAQKADLAAEMRSQAEQDAWDREVANFMTQGPGSGLSQSHAAMVAFDNVVKQVTSDPANLKLSDRAQLKKAFKIYSSDMAKAGYGSADQIELARSLGDMGGGRGGADFGSIDSMIAAGDLAGAERALSRMSKDERDRYGY